MYKTADDANRKITVSIERVCLIRLPIRCADNRSSLLHHVNLCRQKQTRDIMTILLLDQKTAYIEIRYLYHSMITLHSIVHVVY